MKCFYFFCDIYWWGHLKKSVKVTATVCLCIECTGFRHMVHRVHKLIVQKTLHRWQNMRACSILLNGRRLWHHEIFGEKRCGIYKVWWCRQQNQTTPVLLRAGGYLILYVTKSFSLSLSLSLKPFNAPTSKRIPCWSSPVTGWKLRTRKIKKLHSRISCSAHTNIDHHPLWDKPQRLLNILTYFFQRCGLLRSNNRMCAWKNSTPPLAFLKSFFCIWKYFKELSRKHYALMDL